MNCYLKINGVNFTLGELQDKLGIQNIECIQLCQAIPSGTLQATSNYGSDEPYPAIDIDLILPDSKNTSPIQITHVEQPTEEDGSRVKAYLYGRNGEYIAHMTVDDRPESEVITHPTQDSITMSGSPTNEPIVYFENCWAQDGGRLKD